MSRKPKNTVVVEFKDPDLGRGFECAGVNARAISKLEKKAEFGEYWKLELTMTPDGNITGAKFV